MTSIVIITVYVLVGQVQTSIAQKIQSKDNGLKAMKSTENVIIRNETECFHFDFNTRGWQTYNSWKVNEPQVIEYGKIAYSVKIGNRKRQHLLLSGGDDRLSYLNYKPGIFGNWLYTVDTNSWQNVDNGDFPRISEYPLMIKICTKIIAFEFDLTSRGIYRSNKAWIFDTVLLNWETTQVDGPSPYWIYRRDTRNPFLEVVSVSVVVPRSQNNCQCKQSAFILSDLPNTMHELRCDSREGTESYKWVYFRSNVPNFSRFQFRLAYSYSTSVVLYVPANRTLWKFENRVWKNVTTVPDHLQPFYDVSQSKAFGSAVVRGNISYVVFNIRAKKVLNFDLSSNEFNIENVVGDIPDSWYDEVVSSVVEDENTIIVFTIDLHSSRTRVWKFMCENNVWVWKRFSSPDLVPSLRGVTTFDMKSNCFTFTGVFQNVPDRRFWTRIIWELDLTSMQWSFKAAQNVSNSIPYKDYVYEASCWISSCCFVALSNNVIRESIEAWMYNVSDQEWRLLISNTSLKQRTSMSFVAANNTTAVLFGGANFFTILETVYDETWILHLEPTFQWRQAAGNISKSVRPGARLDHAAVMMQSKMYVFGGNNASLRCLDDLWVFDVDTERWKELTADNKGPSLLDAWSCSYSAASTPGQLLITVMYTYADSDYFVLETWMFIVHARMWHLVLFFRVNENSASFLDIGNGIDKSFYWKGFLVSFDLFQKNIKYLAVRCPAGFTSSNMSERPCNFCKQGYYRETIYADQDCVKCPKGLTTDSIGARKIEECTVCKVDRCKFGKCVADFSKGSLRAACECHVGFTGSTCQYPTYFLIAAGIILFVAVASAGVTAYLLVLHRKNMSERVLRKEVDVLTNVWQIDEDEVMSRDLELLGSGASGRVYKASYRNIIVAVKKMMAVGFRKSIEDFETEIKFMRTVRHKNIVLFIGAGKSQPGDVPFLVMEYMERGSLRNVLYDLSIDIDYERKLSFAMDSARGMHFLHTLEPPRIHRDLKSDNLLVSKDWIVKVADFGLGRDVTGNVRSNDGQQNRCRYRSDPQTIPLLPQRDGLSFSGVGTARWQAPELILREPYDTAVDVYRYYY